MLTDRATDAAALGAVTSPWWFPYLSQVSEAAAILLPILGAVWLVVKIVTTIDAWWTGRKLPKVD